MQNISVRSFTFSLLLFSLFFAAQTLYAQTEAAAGDAAAAGFPRVIHYSGELRDGGGQALSGVQGVTLAIYSEQSGGAALWMETQNVEADAWKGDFGIKESLPIAVPIKIAAERSAGANGKRNSWRGSQADCGIHSGIEAGNLPGLSRSRQEFG